MRNIRIYNLSNYADIILFYFANYLKIAAKDQFFGADVAHLGSSKSFSKLARRRISSKKWCVSCTPKKSGFFISTKMNEDQ
jgi:hypothetical protein